MKKAIRARQEITFHLLSAHFKKYPGVPPIYCLILLMLNLGSSLVVAHVPTHPFPKAIPDPYLTLTQTLDLTQGRGGMWPKQARS